MAIEGDSDDVFTSFHGSERDIGAAIGIGGDPWLGVLTWSCDVNSNGARARLA